MARTMVPQTFNETVGKPCRVILYLMETRGERRKGCKLPPEQVVFDASCCGCRGGRGDGRVGQAGAEVGQHERRSRGAAETREKLKRRVVA